MCPRDATPVEVEDTLLVPLTRGRCEEVDAGMGTATICDRYSYRALCCVSFAAAFLSYGAGLNSTRMTLCPLSCTAAALSVAYSPHTPFCPPLGQSIFALIVEQFQDMLVQILLGAAVISLVSRRTCTAPPRSFHPRSNTLISGLSGL